MAIEIPVQLILQACADLQARADNAGSWPNGLPDSFQKIRKIRNLDDDYYSWVITVENIVKNEAIKIVSMAQFVANEEPETDDKRLHQGP